MSEQDSTTRSGKASTLQFSYKRGIECFFDVDDVTIRVWGSVWTGRKVVELNDRVVSSKYSFRYSTPHDFEYAGHRYRVVFSISTTTGLIEIQLFRDGLLIDSDQAHHPSIPIDPETGRVDWRRQLPQLLAYGLIGGALGGVFGFLVARLVGGIWS